MRTNVLQAAQLIEVLSADRPGDLNAAWQALGRRRASRSQPGIDALQKLHPEARRALLDEIG